MSEQKIRDSPSVWAGAESAADDSEPSAAKGVAVPTLLIAALGFLVYWGDMYLMNNGGGFSAQVYHPYTSTNELALIHGGGKVDPMAEGARVFAVCANCHQANGQGNPALFVPPLVGSEWVLEKGPGRIIRIVSKGLTGPLTVKGQSFGLGSMTVTFDQLEGTEETKAKQIAAVLTYVRNSWGNKAPPVTVEQVKKVREKIKSRAEMFTQPELLGMSPDE